MYNKNKNKKNAKNKFPLKKPQKRLNPRSGVPWTGGK
jgi:hypothetical protein